MPASRRDKTDGLYWEVAAREKPSPIDPDEGWKPVP
jgi:hypothetical protein